MKQENWNKTRIESDRKKISVGTGDFIKTHSGALNSLFNKAMLVYSTSAGYPNNVDTYINRHAELWKRNVLWCGATGCKHNSCLVFHISSQANTSLVHLFVMLLSIINSCVLQLFPFFELDTPDIVQCTHKQTKSKIKRTLKGMYN